MHQVIRKNLEDYLKGSIRTIPAEFHQHVGACEDCASELEQLAAQSQLVRSLRDAKDAEPRAGFYARVMERIEAQQPFSIWSVFLERKFGLRLAVVSGVFAALLGAYLVTSEPSGPENGTTTSASISGTTSSLGADASLDQDRGRDAVLVDLASFRQ